MLLCWTGKVPQLFSVLAQALPPFTPAVWLLIAALLRWQKVRVDHPLELWVERRRLLLSVTRSIALSLIKYQLIDGFKLTGCALSYSCRMLQWLSAKLNWLGVQWSVGKTVAMIVLLEPEIGRCSELLDISSKNPLFYFIRPARTDTIAVRSPFWNISLAPTSEPVLSLHHSLKWC